jgi:hypothetical protein
MALLSCAMLIASVPDVPAATFVIRRSAPTAIALSAPLPTDEPPTATALLAFVTPQLTLVPWMRHSPL